MGTNIWINPTKFALSEIIVLWTMDWYLFNYPFSEKSKKFTSIAASSLMIIEIIMITGHAARWVSSHYNTSSMINEIVFGIMECAIGTFSGIVFWFFIKSFSSKLEFPNYMKWSFIIDWFTFIFASAIGGSMISQLNHNIGITD